MAEGRSILRMLFQNFKTALGFRPVKGRYVGSDELGNKYYQVVENYKTSRKHPIRWFEPLKQNDWQQNLPAEWEAWLRNRRTDPPTVEEIAKNAFVAQVKMEKGDNIAKESKKDRPQMTSQFQLGKKGFPLLDDFEKDAGSSFDEHKS